MVCQYTVITRKKCQARAQYLNTVKQSKIANRESLIHDTEHYRYSFAQKRKFYSGQWRSASHLKQISHFTRHACVHSQGCKQEDIIYRKLWMRVTCIQTRFESPRTRTWLNPFCRAYLNPKLHLDIRQHCLWQCLHLHVNARPTKMHIRKQS